MLRKEADLLQGREQGPPFTPVASTGVLVGPELFLKKGGPDVRPTIGFENSVRQVIVIQQPDVAARVGIEALTDDFPVFQKAQGDRYSPINRSLIGCRPIGDDSLLQFVLSLPKGFESFAINQGEKETQHLRLAQVRVQGGVRDLLLDVRRFDSLKRSLAIVGAGRQCRERGEPAERRPHLNREDGAVLVEVAGEPLFQTLPARFGRDDDRVGRVDALRQSSE